MYKGLAVYNSPVIPSLTRNGGSLTQLTQALKEDHHANAWVQVLGCDITCPFLEQLFLPWSEAWNCGAGRWVVTEVEQRQGQVVCVLGSHVPRWRH